MMNFLSSLMGSGPAASPDDAVRAVAENRALVIDVREADEVRATGKAKGALNLPLSGLHLSADPRSGHFDRTLAHARDEGRELYLYCASGARSARAAGVLRQAGFDKVHNLGTLQAWTQAGGQITR